MKKLALLLVHLFGLQVLNAQVIAGDFADPSIIKANNGYYAVGTSSEWAPHFPIYRSSDLQRWTQVGFVFDKAPDWTVGSFWAPEYYFHNNTYYIYYTARRKKDNISCIGVATSKFPDKGFTDHGVIVDYGKEAIDAFVYNDNGQLYLSFKAYGLDQRPIELLGSKLSADGLKLEGELFSMLKDDEKQGMEGQSILKKGDYYYLFYSAGGCCGNGCSYNVSVARSKTFTGPYEKYSQNPILTANDAWKCPGHGTFLQEGGRYVYLYHAYNKQSNVFTGRQGMLATLTWPQDNGWPSFSSQPAGGPTSNDLRVSFTAKTTMPWQWDFRHANPVIRYEAGKLRLSGTATEGNQTGVVITVRPVSDHFVAGTTVENSNGALKGLAFYGDANAAIGIGTNRDSVVYWMVKDNRKIILASQKLSHKAPVVLTLTMHPDRTCEVAFTQNKNGTGLQPLGPKTTIDFLPQWDRSPRIGLHFQGAPDEEAVFSDFKLINQ